MNYRSRLVLIGVAAIGFGLIISGTFGSLYAQQTVSPDCVTFCQKTAQCRIKAGKKPGKDELNCLASCSHPNGSYVRLAPMGWLCVKKSSGAEFDQCSKQAVMYGWRAQLLGGLVEMPADWPKGFPMFYYGTPRIVPAMGTMKAKTLIFPLTPWELQEAVKAELLRTGWKILSQQSESRPGQEGHVRWQTRKADVKVQVSIYRTEGKTVLLLVY